MKKDIILKRIFCVVCILLGLVSLWNDFQNLLAGRGTDTGSLLSIILIGYACYMFCYPEKLKWREVTLANVAYYITIFSGLLCVVYLLLGLSLGCPENWKFLCAVCAVAAMIGIFVLLWIKSKRGSSK